MAYNDFLMANEINLKNIAKDFAHKIEEAKEENNVTEEIVLTNSQNMAIDIIEGLEYENKVCREFKKIDPKTYDSLLIAEEKKNEQIKQNLLKQFFNGQAQFREIEDVLFENKPDAKAFLDLILIGIALNCLNLFKENKASEELLDNAKEKLEVLRELS